MSKAVRTPNRAETSLLASVPAGPGVVTRIDGNPSFESEELLAYELGWRYVGSDKLTTDFSIFYNDYHDLRAIQMGIPIPGVPLVLPSTSQNLMEGESYGGEVSVTWQVLDQWRLSGHYSLLQIHLRNGFLPRDPSLESSAGDSPQQQIHMRSLLDLPWNLEFDLSGYWVDELSGLGVPSYLKLDTRIGWRPRNDLEISIGVLNLLDPYRPEFGGGFQVEPAETQRHAYIKASWTF